MSTPVKSAGFDSLPRQLSPEALKICREKKIRLDGGEIYLAPLSESHLTETYASWLNDPEVTRHTRHGTSPYTLAKVRDYFEKIRDSEETIVFAIHLKENDLHVGNISLNDISWGNHSGEISILLGDRRYWGKGLGRDAVRLVIQFGFECCQLHRLWVGMTTTNAGMITIARSLGFQEEGVLKDALFKEGVYQDITQWFLIRPSRKEDPRR